MALGPIGKEDYEEPCCPFEKPDEIHSIAIGRVIEKLDEYLSRNDYASAERHLRYWRSEALENRDRRGLLSVLNEQIGLYRKLGKEAEGLEAIDSALKLADELGMQETITMGTTLVNAATAYKAFHQPQKALPLYERAREIYESSLDKADSRLGGLYNNMALTEAELEHYDTAEELFQKALSVMKHVENGEIEQAITYCNLADLVTARDGYEKAEPTVQEYMDLALELLDTPTLPRNGYYAFVCEKCAPAFGYYGYFMAEEDLKKRAKDIYERN